MTLFASIFLACLAFVNWRHSRSILFPPVVFCILWASILMGLVLSGDYFYRLTAVTLLACTLGCLAFSAGAIGFNSLHRIARFRGWRSRSVLADRSMLRTIDLVFVAFVCLYPFYWRMLTVIGEGSQAVNLFQTVRLQMVQQDVGGFGGFYPYRYVLECVVVMTLIVCTETCRQRLSNWRLALWIALMLAFYIPTGSRLGSLVTLLGVLAVFTFVQNRVPLLATLSVTMAVLAVFSVTAISLGKGGSLYASTSQNISGVAHSFQLYALGGIVACDQRLQSPPEQSDDIPSLHFFTSVAAALGLHSQTPPRIQPEISIPWRTNVYSIYYSYLVDFGWAGMFAVFFGLGAAFSVLYSAAVKGRPEAVTLLGLGCSYLVFTCSGDPFITSLSSCIQATLLVLMIYNVAPLLRLCKVAHSRPPTLRRGQNRAFHGNIARHYHRELEH
jgi:oligosaccharide repeat unit polymerase